MQSSRKFSTGVNKRASRLSGLSEDPGISPYRNRIQKLHNLFREIELEFEQLYAEKELLQEKLDALGASRDPTLSMASGNDRPPESLFEAESVASKSLKSKISTSSSKLKASHKIKAAASKISNFKAHNVVSTVVREFVGHKDGVWHVACKQGQPIIGSASADHLASIWSIDSGKCLLQYQGHNGSVNSIKFHPSQDLVLTASGDGTAHIWQAAVNYEKYARKAQSSDDELSTEKDSSEEQDRIDVLRTPLCEFGGGSSGHTSVVVAADWLAGNEQIITAGWDRIAILWNVETKEQVQSLTGHDSELTYVSAHPTQKLVVTASRDSTFRLWDFRTEIPAVSVFQGHTEEVTSAILTKDDKVVSGSDDRSVKVWELRNMRSALAHIRTDSAVNRLAVSSNSVIAIPHDNRDVRLFDLNGNRIARLSRTNRQGHTRMVSCVSWSEDPTSSINLYSAGFDKRVLGWNLCLSKDN